MDWPADEKSDREMAHAIADTKQCDLLLRKYRRQRAWFPLFAVLGYSALLVICVVFIDQKPHAERSALPQIMPLVSFGFFGLAYLGMMLMNQRINLLMVIRSLKHGGETTASRRDDRK